MGGAAGEGGRGRARVRTVALTPMAPMWLLMPVSFVFAARTRTSSLAIMRAAVCARAWGVSRAFASAHRNQEPVRRRDTATCTCPFQAGVAAAQPSRGRAARTRTHAARTMSPFFAAFLISPCTRFSSLSSWRFSRSISRCPRLSSQPHPQCQRSVSAWPQNTARQGAR